MDGTLIEGPNARFFRRYIVQNPHKQHHIVTFRDQDWADEIGVELRKAGMPAFDFVSVNACPQHLWEAYTMARFDPDEWLAANPQSAEEALPLCYGYLTNFDHVVEYLNWKGHKAAELGCTVLVDDLMSCVISGCNAHGVTYVDAHSLEFRGLRV